MRLELNPLEILASLAGGVLVALLIVLGFALFGQVGQLSPANSPVRAIFVNCITARARSRQESAAPVSAQLRRVERQCANHDSTGGTQATPLSQSALAPTAPAPPTRATRTARTHGWRKAATPRAN